MLGSTPRFDLTTFGEGVLRFSVPAGHRIETATTFDVNVSGTEANVAGALSRLGWNCGWLSALPNTPPGRRVAHAYRNHGIDLSAVVWRDTGRVSCYYVEYANPPRPIKIYYDRKDSCFTQLSPAEINWDYLLNTRHLHLSGLTVPLSDNTQAVISEALQRARNKGITTSFDINYRKLLWTPEQARTALLPLASQVDLLFCGRRDAVDVLSCEEDLIHPQRIIQQLAEMTGVRNIIVSLSKDGLLGWDGSDYHRVEAKKVWIIDRIGAGDAMIAGVLHGWLRGNLLKGLDYGVVMAALALSQFGDTVITHTRELESLLEDDEADIVR